MIGMVSLNKGMDVCGQEGLSGCSRSSSHYAFSRAGPAGCTRVPRRHARVALTPGPVEGAMIIR